MVVPPTYRVFVVTIKWLLYVIGLCKQEHMKYVENSFFFSLWKDFVQSFLLDIRFYLSFSHTAHGVLKARIMKWFASPFSSRSCFVTGKDPDAGKDWRQEKGMTEDEMVWWHYQLDGREFEQTPEVGDGQGSLACCSPWGCNELDTTEWLNWLTDWLSFSGCM